MPRILLNLRLRQKPLSALQGKVIDLGAKGPKGGYVQNARLKGPVDWVFTDLNPEREGVEAVDFNKTFPAHLKGFDFVLLFNVLEHVEDSANLLGESARILKKGGRLQGCVPFLVPYHADPDDYYRYTHSALKTLFAESGFKVQRLEALGFGPWSLGFWAFPTPRFLRPLFQGGLFVLDWLFLPLSKRYAQHFTLLYLFELSTM